MTQEEKQLLLKDLCARLPHGVQCEIGGLRYGPYTFTGNDVEDLIAGRTFKPYLRPMSSMTEEELKELNDKYGGIAYFFIQEQPYCYGLQAQHSDIGSIEISEFSEIYDWLDAHHFDYRGLIEKGLALEAPEDMYKTE